AQAAALEQDVEDRPRPALADQLDRLVVAGAAARCGYRFLGGRAGGGHRVYAARRSRVASTEPSIGISPATLTMAVKDSRDSTAIASSSWPSSQPASRASSWR